MATSKISKTTRQMRAQFAGLRSLTPGSMYKAEVEDDTLEANDIVPMDERFIWVRPGAMCINSGSDGRYRCFRVRRFGP
ncbi:hypothetical protein LSAT2_002482 [Lamellibrachia satsuma]|nr:hypothetical protein LSAT2_002482 [Lamellibrachia satsuma]